MLSQAPYNQTNDIKFLLTRMRIVVTHIFHPHKFLYEAKV